MRKQNKNKGQAFCEVKKMLKTKCPILLWRRKNSA
jgi:hypothetical protein